MKSARSFFALIAIFLAAGSLVACSESGPSTDDISKAIRENLPAFISLNDFSVEATENLGSETEPKFKSRIIGELVFLDDTFERVGQVGGVPILKKLIAKGTTRKAFGYSTSTMVQNKWTI